MRLINYVCGSLVNINWISSRSGIHMFPLRAQLIKSSLEPKSTITLIGSVSIMRQGGGISPGSSSWTRRRLALLRETPLLCACFRGWAFVWNQRWMRLLRPPCSIFLPWRRWRTVISLHWAQRIWKWKLLLNRQRHCGITSLSWLCTQPEASPWGFVCTVPPILAEAHFA